MSRTLVVVGNGMVAHRLSRELRERDTRNRWRVVVFGEESRPAYDRLALSERLESGEDPLLPPVPGAEIQLSTAVTGIDREQRVVTTSHGDRTAYDALVLATGSRPFVPPIEGREFAFPYRTLDDLDAIRAAAAAGRRGVVIGGGLLGLEAANALRLLGIDMHVVEVAPWLMPAQLDGGGGRMLHRLIAELGVRVHCGTAIERIEGGRGRASAARLSDGTVLEADVVVFSAGVRPRDELAGPTGLPVGERGGFLVDSRCRTIDERIWAVGDCAAVGGGCYGLVEPGYAMADAVVTQLLGAEAWFPGADLSTRLKLLGVEVGVFGDAKATGARTVHADTRTGTYAKLITSRGRVLRGGVLVGDASAYPTLCSMIGRVLPADPAELLLSA